MAEYEDDYDFRGNVVRYFPTYQSLTDAELRGYFTWRTKLRRGDLQKTSLTFAFLYIYELLNLIGVSDAMDGYRRLTTFRDTYGQMDPGILPYLKKWIVDFVVYYDLDANLLAEHPQVQFDRCAEILANIRDQADAKVLFALKQLSPKWLERSKFYKENTADMDRVLVSVLRRVSDHYDSRCKKGFADQFFGQVHKMPVPLFESAVFCNPLKRNVWEYTIDRDWVYQCSHGAWTVTRRMIPPRTGSKLNDLTKVVDAAMRDSYGYKNLLKAEPDTKWLQKIIQEEIRSLLEEKKAAEAKKLHIDYSQLSRIRRDAAITREKLIVEEEMEEDIPVPQPQPEPITQDVPETVSMLSPEEYRLLQCLLYNRDYSWIHQEGLLLSVLLDSINDKLYDIFLDSVLDDTPAPLEDYIDELKEMVSP